MVQKGFNLIIGSQYVFGCLNYDEYDDHKKVMSSVEKIPVPTEHLGIATKKGVISVRLDNVIVDVHPPYLNEVGTIKTGAGGNVEYSPTSGIFLTFKQDEFNKYIHDAHKVIDVYLSVSIGMKKAHKDECAIIVRR